LDVDGTLVDRRGEIFPGAFELVSTAESLGLTTALCSARSTVGLLPVARALLNVRWLSALGGAKLVRIEREFSGAHLTDVAQTAIDPETCVTLMTLFADAGLQTWAFTSDAWFVSSVSERVRYEVRTNDSVFTLAPLPSFPSDGILKYVIPQADLSAYRALYKDSQELGVSVAFSTKHQLEIVSLSVADKGVSALKAFLGQLDTACIAVGDGMNDIPMLRAASLGYTFMDSPRALKAVANSVLPSDRTMALSVVRDSLRALTS